MKKTGKKKINAADSLRIIADQMKKKKGEKPENAGIDGDVEGEDEEEH